MLKTYLPERYRADKAYVVDSKGAFSDQIDVVVYDRQYSPFIFTYENETIIPAESVYAVFEAKRQMLLDVDRKGGYIPVCTRNVFLKYYTPANAHQNHFWGPQDRNHYLDTILEIAKPYFLNEEKMA